MALKPNGKDNSLRGHHFDPEKPETLPSYVLKMAPEQQVEWATKETERYRIVETCEECGRDLIAEELVAHKLNHFPSKLRALGRMIVALEVKDRNDLLKRIKKVV